MLDLKRIQRLHIFQLKLPKKADDQASGSVNLFANLGESERELPGFNPQIIPVYKPVVSNEQNRNLSELKSGYIPKKVMSAETASPKIPSQKSVENSFSKTIEIWQSKIGSWGIHHKIGGGYFVAIGIGFFGSMSGLLIADYHQGQGVKQLNDAHQQAQLLGNFKDAALAAQLQ